MTTAGGCNTGFIMQYYYIQVSCHTQVPTAKCFGNEFEHNLCQALRQKRNMYEIIL